MTKQASNVTSIATASPDAQTAAFDIACEMENGLAAIIDFAEIINELGSEMSGPQHFDRLAVEIASHAQSLEAAGGKLFRMLHPRREYFERVGWPDGDIQ